MPVWFRKKFFSFFKEVFPEGFEMPFLYFPANIASMREIETVGMVIVLFPVNENHDTQIKIRGIQNLFP